MLILNAGYLIKMYIDGQSFSLSEEYTKVLISGIGMTFIIVTWEELIFRGVILNYVQKFSSDIRISFINGLLFTLIHLFNPEFNIVAQGLNLFFAGFLLTFLYLKFKNIWLPIGVLFANNVFYSKVGLLYNYIPDKQNPFISNEGYMDILILIGIIIIIYFLKPEKKAYC